MKELEVPMGKWTQLAACRDADEDELRERFFGPEEMQRIAARDWCSVCVVKEECLDTALLNKETNGLWGGMTETERARLLKAAAKNRRRSA